MIFFLRSIFAQLFLNAFIIFRIWRNKEVPPKIKYILLLVIGVEVITYFTGLFYFQNFKIEILTLIQKMSGIWTIFQVYLISLIVVFDILYFINKRWRFLSAYSSKWLKIIKITCFILCTIFICSQLYVGYRNFLNPDIKQITFKYPNQSSSGTSGPVKIYKLLLISDLHLGYIIDKEVLQKYVRIINEQHPDIIVIDGDLVDYELRPLIAQKMDDDLRNIKAPKGVFFIPGNHEYKFNPEIKLNWIRNCGMTILKDSIANIDNELYLIGRDDRSNEENREPIDSLMNKVDTSKPCIFLAHQPADINDAYEYKIPLTLCGHTHQGQAFPFNLVVKLIYTNGYGIQHKDGCTSYTTSGLGLSGFPLRICTHSEIVIFNIEIY